MVKKILVLVLAAGTMASCTNQNTGNESEAVDEPRTEDQGVVAEAENDAPESYKKGGLKIYPFTGSDEFPGAKLTLKAPKEGLEQAGKKVNFDFTVEGYELGAQTAGAGENGLANSAKGQHIHLIIDNDPYSAHYEPTFEKEVEEGHHVAIAFLSRSFHESVKNPDAFQVFQFSIGEGGKVQEPVNMKDPMLFYSRPKGEYSGEDTRKILFDFYLKNAELKPDGYSVIATVNDSLEFEFDEWQPYIIEGLPMGENTINIKLVNAQGTSVDTKMNDITRTFTLKP